ncbi:MAG: PQQ-dependent sugar dehydrogenase [Eubacteriales bacterium]|nr:PQQ-dependent sugar dehydrogenase [Eubacteriales bacterium]
MSNVKVRLQPLVSGLNLPTVLKTAILPGDSTERLFITTQLGEIFYIGNGVVEVFMDIRPRIIELGASRGGYDERGLLGLAFHPGFSENGLFYLHYSAAGTQGPGALSGSFNPDPCSPETLRLQWQNRETQYDHIDTVEEWILPPNDRPQQRRTLLNLLRPFFNHNGINSLNFSPETGKLVLTTGDGGSGYDPFNLAQNDMEIAGKIIEIDVDRNLRMENPTAVTRFDELPPSVQETLTVIAKGVRNIPGISFQRLNNRYIKYAGNVGQDLVESIYSFDQTGSVNFGWRGWEGDLPTLILRGCSADSAPDAKITAYYNEAIMSSSQRLQPLTSYYHQDSRPGKFEGTALTGVQPYMGSRIPGLTGSVVFTDFVRKDQPRSSAQRGVLAYTREDGHSKSNDYYVIDVEYDFGSQSAFYTSLGTNMEQSRLYLGVSRSANVTAINQGTVFEVVGI